MLRVPTGINGLDEMLSGGLAANSVTLVTGAPGAGKTNLGLQFIHSGIAQYDQPGLIVTFESFPSALFHDAEGFGWDLKGFEREARLGILFTSPAVFLKDIDAEIGVFTETVRRLGAKRILVDSASHFIQWTETGENQRTAFYKMLNAMKRAGLTIMLTYEDVNIFGGIPQDHYELPFLVDTIIMLRYVELDSALSKSIFVLKHRGSNHDKQIREMRIKGGSGIEVVNKFSGIEGLLSGNVHRSMEASFDQAFLRK